ncbi:MAG: tetratricopeptide repeat protein [Candidatus Binatia bacterium]
MHPRTRVGTTIGRIGAGALVLWTATAGGRELASASSTAREALAICAAADAVPADERAAQLATGLARAEAAVQADPGDAAAHLAVFCNLGKRLRTRTGWALLTAFSDLRRARNAIDAALALVPDYPGALAGKGQMLAELPGWLGGDRQEAVRLLRRAVAIEPDDARMRLMLASALQAVGQRDEARAHALAALGSLERDGSEDDRETARTLVASLQ